MKTNFINKPKHGEPIYRNGRIYDSIFKNYREDIPFYINQFRRYGGRVLELACGTGRITIPVAKAGFDIMGIDNAPGMLRTAKENTQEASLQIKYKRADIRKFKIIKKFNLIFLPGNSICHLYDLKSLKACFKCVREHLLPGGKFFIAFFNPSIDLLSRKNLKLQKGKFIYNDPESGKKVIISEIFRYNRKTQINHIFWHYNFKGKKFIDELKMRIYFPQELDALLKLNGFRIIRKYGNFDCSEFTSDSPKQIYVCSVKK